VIFYNFLNFYKVGISRVHLRRKRRANRSAFKPRRAKTHLRSGDTKRRRDKPEICLAVRVVISRKGSGGAELRGGAILFDAALFGCQFSANQVDQCFRNDSANTRFGFKFFCRFAARVIRFLLLL